MKEEYDFLKGRKNPYDMIVDKYQKDSNEPIVTEQFKDEAHDLHRHRNDKTGK